MRMRIAKLLSPIPCALLLLLMAQVLQAPIQGGQQRGLLDSFNPPSFPPAILASSGPASPAAPLAIWDCISTWYGEPFDGQLTASGEPYDMFAQTAAHPTLPLGSVVRVVNLRNHRSAVVRINDRGPYVEGRELDVSYEVARQLGFDERGLARVRLELLEVPQRIASALNRSND
jgi:hypothetical protein